MKRNVMFLFLSILTGVFMLSATVSLAAEVKEPEVVPSRIYEVDAIDYEFVPAYLTVRVGDTVHWSQSDGFHNVRAYDDSFYSGPVGATLDYSRVFTVPGLYTYFCEPHFTVMTGTINVLPLTETVSVGAADFYFDPAVVVIDVGDAVNWTQAGVIPHNVLADDASFYSGSPEINLDFTHTFNTAGAYPYYCEPHGGPGGQGMAGTVLVRGTEKVYLPIAVRE